MNKSRARTRLSPEARQDQLLDTTRDMVIESGLQAFTMEGLAHAAGVSAPLVYNYFPNRPVLLQSLLRREYQRFAKELLAATKDTKNFADIVRISVTANFDHQAPGKILSLLLSQPEIAEAIKTERDQHNRQNARFLVQAAAQHYALDSKQARLAISMSSGASIAAAELAEKTKLDREETIQLAVNYILAGIERIAQGEPRP